MTSHEKENINSKSSSHPIGLSPSRKRDHVQSWIQMVYPKETSNTEEPKILIDKSLISKKYSLTLFLQSYQKNIRQDNELGGKSSWRALTKPMMKKSLMKILCGNEEDFLETTHIVPNILTKGDHFTDLEHRGLSDPKARDAKLEQPRKISLDEADLRHTSTKASPGELYSFNALTSPEGYTTADEGFAGNGSVEENDPIDIKQMLDEGNSLLGGKRVGERLIH
ncbi:uncharacterized protein MELLADRAFT_108867 [Melampsora larici-populina 98AG31]|uniref:Uncharacterized protein n=1 Tax=Melampsora larici-populina (strain 98AG31 / pathotype 3-4-7) TaxID=747676 RepID=F4RUJ2_MELLP|nr:uncharacterized protein MELLADRAFT_108867 [Melampsora larici-populina 98AG31]EGG03989.1 hypothetical protein MELLADRAFT_108867 [Melampsora larici-populina 98AG31]